jgi:hypothetical protein
MSRRDRTAFDCLYQSRAMGRIQDRRLPGGFAVNQSVGPGCVELHNPVSDDLQRHAAEPRRLRSACSLIDRRQRKQSPGLPPIFRSACRCPGRGGVKIGTKRDGHGKTPAVRHVESTRAPLGNPLQSHALRDLVLASVPQPTAGYHASEPDFSDESKNRAPHSAAARCRTGFLASWVAPTSRDASFRWLSGGEHMKVWW